MKKNALWWIIGLMSTALLGVIVMQAYWINQSISLSEEQFNKNVFMSLNSVVSKLELAEVYATTSDFLPPSFGGVTELEKEEILDVARRNQSSVDFSFVQDLPSDSLLVFESTDFFENHGEDCQCVNCQNNRIDTHLDIYYRQFTKAFAQRSTCNKPITQRIDFKHFDELLAEEFKNQGIQIDYAYGVYSDRRKSFVVMNTHLEKEKEGKEKVLKASLQDLVGSKYKVKLFPSDIDLPGYLVIHFPGRVGYVWRSVLPTLLGSILFSGVILFCFAYTIQVIFEQKKLSEIKNDFINNMTHEFKTPIATISLAADSIGNPMILNNPDKVQRFTNIIKAENKRMNKQVEKVLSMALLDKREVSLSIRQINVHEIISRAVDNISLQVEKKDGKILQDLQADNPTIEADETHISNVIHNLLDNANKYTPENPQISVHTRNITEGVQIMIKDNGLGMSKEQRRKIFDKFYRVPTGNRHDIKGFGLGLSYVKAIVTEHKGDISVQSELGKGSRFILTFKHKMND
ncbi:MAG: two-component system phosphate regulon sensor histidine kinase PhoR [Cognaticolwellia sp.]|jgi:two-component system phosphate regulon sensor histidine kinase PhoR